jgi:hypothetical protein
LGFPDLIDGLAALESFDTTFHDGDDFALTILRIDA